MTTQTNASTQQTGNDSAEQRSAVHHGTGQHLAEEAGSHPLPGHGRRP